MVRDEAQDFASRSAGAAADSTTRSRRLGMVVPLGPLLVTMGPMVTIELERVEVLELLVVRRLYS